MSELWGGVRWLWMLTVFTLAFHATQSAVGVVSAWRWFGVTSPWLALHAVRLALDGWALRAATSDRGSAGARPPGVVAAVMVADVLVYLAAIAVVPADINSWDTVAAPIIAFVVVQRWRRRRPW